MNSRLLPSLLVVVACSADAPIADVGINEIATAQPAGDWVELMNVTAATIDLDGWTIEMDETSYAFDADATLPANGYVTLDGLDLADAGGMVDLVDADGAVVDQVDFPSAQPDEGYGRVPDAAANWQRLGELTPGAPNR